MRTLFGFRGRNLAGEQEIRIVLENKTSHADIALCWSRENLLKHWRNENNVDDLKCWIVGSFHDFIADGEVLLYHRQQRVILIFFIFRSVSIREMNNQK